VSSHRRILVADDNEDIRRDVARLLGGARKRASLGARAARLFPDERFEEGGSEGGADEPRFEVSAASNGDEALELARGARNAGEPFAVAFVDVRMPPGIDGARVGRLLRDEDPDIEIVLITAYADRTLAELNAGPHASDRLLFLRKPYAREEIFQLALSLSEKRLARVQLRAARERLDAILEAASDGICGLDREHRIVFANPAAHSLLALDSGDGASVWARLGEHSPRALPGGSAIEVELGGRWLELGDVAPAAREGDVSGVIAVRDVTARKEVERLKDEFIQNTSHELRTPLVSIRGYLDLAIDERLGELAPPLRRGLDVARRASARLLDLIDALLELARLEAEGSSGRALERERVSLAEVLERVSDVARPTIEAKGLALSIDLDPHAGEVLADPRTLEVAVRNLLGNAIKFTARGAVGIAARPKGASVEVEVWDTGCGLPKGIDPRVLFERFRQGDGSMARAYGGVGIGLALVERILALHGSTVHATNRIPAGASFSFELERPGADLPRPVSALARSNAPATVVIVDPSPDCRDFLTLALRAAGHSVCAMATLDEAFARPELARSPLVIVSGPEAATAVDRLREAFPESAPGPQLALVPSGSSELAVARAAGIAVLERPIGVKAAIELASTIATAPERRDAA
jgi:signal transduction histidine kinase